MQNCTKYNRSNATQASLEQLGSAHTKFGFLPNLLSYMAEQHKIDMKLINTIRADKPLDNPNYATLLSFTRKFVEPRLGIS